jgi:hypothetical protein
MEEKMSKQLIWENAVSDYAHDLLAIHVVREYEYQIGEWQKYINRVLDAEKIALENHQSVVTKVINKKQEQDQKSAMFANLALSLLGGAALSWISGVIQYKLYPKIASTPTLKETHIYLERRGKVDSGNVFLMSRSEKEHNKVTAKIFGDAAAGAVQATGVGRFFADVINKIPKRAEGKSYQELIAVAQIKDNAKSDDLYHSLKTRLENALIDEKTRTVKTISDLALAIKRDTNWGKEVLGHLYKTQPNLKQTNDVGHRLALNKHTEDLIDYWRGEWAKEALYYGRNPPVTSTYEMSRRLEREIWAMWILDMNFSLVGYNNTSYAGEVISGGIDYFVIGRDGISFDSLILDRLIELGVIMPQTKQQFEALNNRNWGNPNKEKPEIIIRKEVDTGSEIDEINGWAAKHPPEMLSGNVDSLPRTLPSIINVHR